MMTDEQKLEFFQKWKGEKVNFSNHEDFKQFSSKTLANVVLGDIKWPFCDISGISWRYARPIQKKERLMTLEDLDGKWITWCDQEELHKIRIVFRNGFFSFGHRSFGTVKQLHEKGGVWNDKPSFEGLKSLMLEVSE
jgi:hypothetical protein